MNKYYQIPSKLYVFKIYQHSMYFGIEIYTYYNYNFKMVSWGGKYLSVEKAKEYIINTFGIITEISENTFELYREDISE